MKEAGVGITLFIGKNPLILSSGKELLSMFLRPHFSLGMCVLIRINLKLFVSYYNQKGRWLMSIVLIVDDSKLSRNALSDILTGAGYEVLEACNGIEAVEMAATQAPDCILLDILMPEMDGFEVLKILKDKELNIPAIIHSADIQTTTRQKCFELGAVGFINKPPKKDKLLPAIEEAIASKKGTDQ